MDINKIRQGSAPQPSSGTTAAGSVDQSSSGPSSAGNLGSSTASGAEVVRSGQVFDRGQTLALSGVSAPTVELATTAWADGQAVVARFQKPAMAVTDLAALIMLLEEVIRVLKSKDRLAQQADSDASLTTDMAAVSKMRTSAADKLEANKKQSNFQMIAGAVQIGMAGAGAFKLRAAGKAASRLGKISSETKDLTNNLKVATGKAAKSDIRQAMRMLREESAAVSNKFNQSLQASGAYTGVGQALGGFASGLGARLAADNTYDSEQATADANQLQSVSRRQSAASQSRAEEVSQLEDLRRKLLDTLAQNTANSSETNKRLINA
jgi:hypothetical protein